VAPAAIARHDGKVADVALSSGSSVALCAADGEPEKLGDAGAPWRLGRGDDARAAGDRRRASTDAGCRIDAFPLTAPLAGKSHTSP
jgi:hypothetical protein